VVSLSSYHINFDEIGGGNGEDSQEKTSAAPPDHPLRKEYLDARPWMRDQDVSSRAAWLTSAAPIFGSALFFHSIMLLRHPIPKYRGVAPDRPEGRL